MNDHYIHMKMQKHSWHRVCFDCRKSFKSFDDKILSNRMRKKKEYLTIGTDGDKCPECGKLMTSLGPFFRAPKQTDKKGWQNAKKLYESRVHFFEFDYANPTKKLWETNKRLAEIESKNINSKKYKQFTEEQWRKNKAEYSKEEYKRRNKKYLEKKIKETKKSKKIR